MARKKKSHFGRNLFLLILIGGCGAAGYVVYQQQNQVTESEITYRQETVKYGSVVSGITESGTVTYGSADQTFTVAEVVSSSSSSSSDMGGMSTGTTSSSSSSASLEVEEVYVAEGQVVAEGDAILKISDESIESYREALESAITSAQLTVKQEEINLETKQAEADYTYAMYIATGETAEETYNATITSLENAVTELEESLAEAAEEVEELQSEYDAGEDVEDDLEEAQLNYETIEANLKIARNNLTTQSIEALQTYENAMTNYKYADQLYEIDTDGLSDDLEDAQATLEEAEAALEEFEEQIGDGIIYSEYSGTVTSVSYSEGDTLTSDATVVSFLDADDVTMSVSVSQDDISSISTGDEVSISLTAYSDETFTAEVSSISTTATTGSSTVNYTVTVLFTSDITKVYSGMTGDVTFVTREETDTLYISNRAVHTDGSRSYVKVLNDDGTIEEVDITTGYSNGSTVAVSSGLEEGQIVLIESQVTG